MSNSDHPGLSVEPLTDAALAEIKARYRESQDAAAVADDVPILLTEVDRLRAESEKLTREREVLVKHLALVEVTLRDQMFNAAMRLSALQQTTAQLLKDCGHRLPTTEELRGIWKDVYHGAEGSEEQLADRVQALEQDVACLHTGLGQMQQERDEAREQLATLRAALQSLTNEAAGLVTLEERALREAVGHTNTNCLIRRIELAKAALAGTAPKEGEKS